MMQPDNNQEATEPIRTQQEQPTQPNNNQRKHTTTKAIKTNSQINEKTTKHIQQSIRKRSESNQSNHNATKTIRKQSEQSKSNQSN